MNGISINVSRDFDGKRPFESKGSGMLSPSLDELSSDRKNSLFLINETVKF